LTYLSDGILKNNVTILLRGTVYTQETFFYVRMILTTFLGVWVFEMSMAAMQWHP
jgi:hypothetical protein